MIPLAAGWEITTGEDLFEFIRGVTYTKDEVASKPFEHSVAILRAGNLQNGKIVLNDLVYVPATRVSDQQRLRVGDLIVAMSSGSASVVGKVSLVQDALPRVSFGAFCGVLRPRTRALSMWLYNYFQSSAYRELISASAAGVNINNLRADHFFQLQFPIPPPMELDRATAKLRELRSRSAITREILAEVKGLADSFRRSLLAAAFCGDLTADWRAQNPDVETTAVLLERIHDGRRLGAQRNLPKPLPVDATVLPELPHGWSWSAVEDLVEGDRKISYGVLKPGPHIPDGVRLLKSGQVREGWLDLSEDFRISPELDQEFWRTRLKGGEVLLNLVGASIGRSAVAPSELAGANVSRAIAVIPAVTGLSRWIQVAFEGPLGQQLVRDSTGGSAQSVLNLSEVRRLPIPMPPESEREVILARLDAAWSRFSPVQSWIDEAAARLHDLDRSILAKAFCGELVPQDPDDEPASVLLERIRAERAAEGGGKPRRGRRKASA